MHMVTVDLGSLGDHAHVLGGVLADVQVRAWPDEIELQVWLSGVFAMASGCCRSEVPPIDVVCAEVANVGQGGMEGTERRELGSKGSSLDGQDAGSLVDRA
jgi:hypothetical protein